MIGTSTMMTQAPWVNLVTGDDHEDEERQQQRRSPLIEQAPAPALLLVA